MRVESADNGRDFFETGEFGSAPTAFTSNDFVFAVFLGDNDWLLYAMLLDRSS